jgi:hypothetical protein
MKGRFTGGLSNATQGLIFHLFKLFPHAGYLYKKRNGSVSSHSLLFEIQRTLLDAGFCQAGNLREPFRVGNGNVGQDLAVNFDIGLFKTENELAVGQPVQA